MTTTSSELRLTQYAAGGGCACKVPPGELERVLAGLPGGRAGGDLLVPWILAAALAVAILSSAIPYTLEMEALRRLPAGVFGVMMSIEPAMGALAGFIVLGEGLAGHGQSFVEVVLCQSDPGQVDQGVSGVYRHP